MPDSNDGFLMPAATERAWAAGFFDGEGHIRATPSAARATGIRMNIPQKNPAALERFRDAVGGFGQISRRTTGHYAGKYAIYVWNLSKMEHVQLAVALLSPYLCQPKRDQIRKAFKDWHAYRDLRPWGFTVAQKFSDQQFAEIRAELDAGRGVRGTQAAIARRYGISASYLSTLANGKAPRRLPGSPLAGRCSP